MPIKIHCVPASQKFNCHTETTAAIETAMTDNNIRVSAVFNFIRKHLLSFFIIAWIYSITIIAFLPLFISSFFPGKS